MKKPFSHDVVSQFKCSVCGKPIKANLVARRKKPPRHCFKHWVLEQNKKGHVMAAFVQMMKPENQEETTA